MRFLKRSEECVESLSIGFLVKSLFLKRKLNKNSMEKSQNSIKKFRGHASVSTMLFSDAILRMFIRAYLIRPRAVLIETPVISAISLKLRS